MERDINVVVRIKEDGSMSFMSGDGLPLQIGGGGEGGHLYRHTITVVDGTYGHGYFIVDCINNSSEPFPTNFGLTEDVNGPVTYVDPDITDVQFDDYYENGKPVYITAGIPQGVRSYDGSYELCPMVYSDFNPNVISDVVTQLL